MGPALAQLVEHLTVVVLCAFYNEVKKGGYVVIKMSLVRIRQAGKNILINIFLLKY